jgi:hypothetical protein
MANQTPILILPLLEGRKGELAAYRFLSKVDMRGPDECWPWLAGSRRKGYGRYKPASHITVAAPRFSYALHYKREPGELCVMHTCDNPGCVNPYHLRLGTIADNNRDKMEKGRWRGGPQGGSNNGAAKLNEADIADIVRMFAAGLNNIQIGATFGVGHAIISLIRLGKAWRSETERLGYTPKSRQQRKAA